MRALPQPASGILSYFTRHRTLANLLFLLLILAGIAAIPNMRTQFFPDVIRDDVRVTTEWERASAEDVDRAIVQVLEPVLLAVEGVESSDALSREGEGTITLEFEPGWDMGRAASDVETAIAGVADLPEEAEEPKVRRGAWRDRVTDVVVTGPVEAEQLAIYADELIVQLFDAGVTRTTIRGVVSPQVMVEVSSAALMAQDITMAEIAEAIAAEVDTSPAGDVTGANARVRTGSEKRTPEAIAQIVLRIDTDGAPLLVGDIATIARIGTDRERSYFVGENPAISIRVDRSNGGDAVGIQSDVEEVTSAFEEILPEGVTATLTSTRSQAISSRLNILIDNGFLGLSLVIGLLFLFLNARTALWVAAGIPVAMMAAIAFMYLGGLTINMISLFGLIITLGIVVDDAIVVGEHADYRARQLGEPAVIAAETAARRMAMPVFAATLTTVIAFFGLVAIGGRFGTLIQDIPLTVIAVLIASLVECFLILPNHMAHALAHRARPEFSRGKLAGAIAVIAVFVVVATAFGWTALHANGDGPFWQRALREGTLPGLYAVAGLATLFLLLPRRVKARVLLVMGTHGVDVPSVVVNRGFMWMRQRLFRPFMMGVIAARYVVLAGVVAILASQAAVFIRGDVTWRFFNAPERGSVTGNFVMAESATRADTIEMMREMQRATESLAAEYTEKYGRNPIDFVISQIGGNAGRRLSGTDGKDVDLLGGISIELIDADERSYSSFAFVADLQDTVVHHPMVETVSFRGWRSGPGGDALDVQFYGADTDTLKGASLDLQTRVSRFPEVSALEDTLAYDKEEFILDLTPQGQALGFTVDALGRALRQKLGGIEAATFPDGPRSAEVRVELPAGELTADFLERTQMRAGPGVYVPLADIVSVERRTGFSTVRRENGVRVISVTGDISEDDAARAAEIQKQLRDEMLPDIAAKWQVSWQMSGLAEQESEFLNDALTGLVLCLAGIFLVLAWVFSSWTRPFVVMAIIPFGLVGTIYGHHLWDVPLSMFTVVGLLGMTGIIINDSIVLITTIDEYAADRGLIPSIIDGASDRLRPVLLTTLTTVLGMTPLLYETSIQALFLKPTVITLVYGLGFGMFLVLLVVPALLAVQHDLARNTVAMRRSLRGPATTLRFGMLSLVFLLGAWGAATIGSVLWSGQLGEIWVRLVPALEAVSPQASAVVVFLTGAAMISLAGYVIGVLSLRRARRRTA
ncbi:MAG: efflux RND transporter permease subunit [Pseudomonadota bacterium]